jgi:ribosomal protein S18 acetylase RimI-like enzyme
MNFFVRHATINDIQFLHDCLTNHSGSDLSFSLSELENLLFPQKKEDPVIPILLLISINSQILVGMLVYTIENRMFLYTQSANMYIGHVYIKENFREKGAGTFLLQEAKKIAVEKGCSRLEFIVLRENQKSLSFFKKMGGLFPENLMPGCINL